MEDIVVPVRIEKGDMAYWAELSFVMEKPRIAATVRLKHLERLHRTSPETARFLEIVTPVEDYVDGMLSSLVTSHPTWPWASRSKGVGKENYPKVIGLIESFGKFYDIGDPMIPEYVTRGSEQYWVQEKINGKTAIVEKTGIWVCGIERLTLPSKLWKYEGFGGPNVKRKTGHKLEFNAELRMALYRLGVSLNRAGGVWYTGSQEKGGSPGYLGYREKIVKRKPRIKVVPTPAGRKCLNCDIEVKEKDTHFCPQCGERLALKTEPEGYLYEGHLHMMALREMLKDFSTCFYLVWRKALGLPVSEPYKVDVLEYPPIDPWVMVDR